jgi:dTDP-4-dehydrorhamnose reductase
MMAGGQTLVVTGANGFVAGSILTQAGDGRQVHAISRGQRPEGCAGVLWHVCDARDPAHLARVFREIKPDAVIHTAALADIDFCEAHPDLARAANVELTRALSDLCADSGCRMVFCSTDTVFDGEHAPYNEEARPVPVNYYAETKVEAEQCVARLGDLGIVARLSLVMGLPVMGAGNSFLARMLSTLRAGREVAMTEREVRSPVDVITAGRALLELASGGHHGIFHLAGNERLNRLTMARRIAQRFGLPPELVVPQPPGAATSRAPRPRDVSLGNAKARSRLRTPMLDFDEALTLIQQTAAHCPI